MRLITIIFIVIILLMLMCGCTTQKPIRVYSECPKVIIPKPPHYPVNDMRRGDSASKVVTAYVATNHLKDAHIATLTNILGEFE